MKHLETKRLHVRPIRLEDAPALFAFWSDPLVARHMNIDTFTELTQAEEMISLLQKLSLEQQACRLTICLKETGEIIGSCGFNYLDFENAKAEIGYDLGHPYWGNGYTPEALHALLEYGFDELGLDRIEAKVVPENINSIRVLHKLRFVEEGMLHEYDQDKGKSIELAMYTLSRSKWDS